MNKSTFIKHINALDNDELKNELLYLYQKITGVKEHYQMDLGNEKDRKKIFSKTKIEISKKFATKSRKRPRRPRIQKSIALLRSLEKVSIFSHEMIDPYLFTAETALIFVEQYYFISTPLLNIIKTSFVKSCDYIEISHLQKENKDRLYHIVVRCQSHQEISAIIQKHYDRLFPQ